MLYLTTKTPVWNQQIYGNLPSKSLVAYSFDTRNSNSAYNNATVKLFIIYLLY